MAGMFYSLQEVAEKLNKTEQEVKEIVKNGRLREFRDGPSLLFKVDEVEALMSDSSIIAAKESAAEPERLEEEEEEITLAPETAEPLVAAGGLADADTAVGREGINILGELDAGEYKPTDDTMAETKAASGDTSLVDEIMGGTKAAAGEASLEEIEEDVNLDTFGSGSGLLDLSLQADDTSLGGILDEIYTSEGEEGQQQAEESGPALEEVAAEAEQAFAEEEPAVEEPVAMPAAAAVAYVEPVPDRSSNIFGLMLFLPLLVLVYTAMVAIAGQGGGVPSILEQIQGIILPVLGGFVVVALILTIVGFMPAGGGSKTAKKPKVKKEKKKKKAEEPALPASEGKGTA
jgi:hypothetical protein